MKTGRYVCVMPDSMLRFRARELGLKTLPVALPHRPSIVAVLTLKNRTLSPVVARFIEHLRAFTASMTGALEPELEPRLKPVRGASS